MFWLGIVAATLAVGCGKQEDSKPGETSVGQNPVTAPVEYLGAVAKAQQTAVKTVDVVSINQAIQMFSAQEGRYPKDLDELVSLKYLPKLPAAPYGMKLVYDAKAGSVKVVKQ